MKKAGISKEVRGRKKRGTVKILDEYGAENIFNANETGLFFKCVMNKSLLFEGVNTSEGKIANNFVMFEYDYRRDFKIGKSKKPDA